MPKISFWKEAVSLQGSVTPIVAPDVLMFGIYAIVLCMIEAATPLNIDAPIAPAEILGAALGVVLILRTTAGYDRWWEGRKTWGGLINQSRNLAIITVEYGPADPPWQRHIVRQIAAFAHAMRVSLRREHDYTCALALLEPAEGRAVKISPHPPLMIARLIARSLRDGMRGGRMNSFAFLEAERQRAQLIDSIGVCERIRDAPLPRVCSIKVRRFMLLFLALLPLAILGKTVWLTPLYTMLAAYVLLSLDQIGIELQNPFAKSQLSHLPLDDLCGTIERNLSEILTVEFVAAQTTRSPTQDSLCG